jgi:hypothetical protein
MYLLQLLFSDWVGILSVITVGFVLVMATYLFFFVRRHIREETVAPRRR